jgi:putative methionine-R-sulfoxide reductase with GAF domain
LSARPSVFDGQIECVSVTITNGVVGHCLWMNAVDLVELVTFSGDLIAVSSMSTQVITELQDHSTTA